MAFEIDISKIKNKPKFSLCLPLPIRSKIQNLVEIDNVNVKLNLGKVHELTFDMPFYVDRENVLIKNPLIDKFESYYQVKMEWNDTVEYFVYINGNRNIDGNGKKISYKLYSSAYLLSKKAIRAYEETSKSLSQHARLMLEETTWSLGFVDGKFDVLYREINISEANVLQSIYDLANKFDALVVFDNTNLKVSFFDADNVGFNKGITFKPTTFIESLGYEIDHDKIVTRLSVYGSDGLEFRRLSPTGSNYIESLDWFIYPYEEDSNGNVIKHSKWLSDDLCKAYKSYQAKIARETPTFKTLTENRTLTIDNRIQQEQELSVLENELKVIENELWVINKTYFDEAPKRSDWQNAVNRKNTKISQINAKKAVIEEVKLNITRIDGQISTLRYSVSVDNPLNFTVNQILEMTEYIYYGTYSNDSITDEQDLLDSGLQAFEEVGKPPITLRLALANFLNELDFHLIHDRLSLGDTVKVKSKEIDVFVQLKIIGIDYNVTSDTLSITISNVKDLKNDAMAFAETIRNAGNTSSTVNLDKFKWNQGEQANTLVNQLLTSAYDASKNAIFGGYQNTTILDSFGLKSIESGDSNTFLIINNGILAITNDGGNSIQVAITKNGVHAERLVGRIIIGERLYMEDENGVWETRGSTTTIFDRNGRESMYIGRLEGKDCYGIIMDNAKHKISLNTCDGFQISKYKSGNSLENVMYIDLDGNIWSKYWTHDTTKIKDSQGYFGLDDNQIVIKDGSQEVMRMGYIPSMSFGGCYIQSDWGVVLKGNNNSNIFMTRNRGFAIDVNCVNKFSVTSSGNLYAQDIEATNLIIKSAKIGSSITINESSGIVIKSGRNTTTMNGTDGFKINNGSMDVFKVGSDGKLYLRNIYTLDDSGETVKDLDGSFISDLTVNRLKTLTKTNRTNFVHIEDNYIKLSTQGLTKMQIKFNGNGTNAYPIIEWGSGDSYGNSVANQYKSTTSFVTEYFASDGGRRAIELTDMNNAGVILESPYGVTFRLGGTNVEISQAGIIADGRVVVPF